MERARKRRACEPADGGTDGPCGGGGRGEDPCPGVGLVYRWSVGAPVPYIQRSYAPCDPTCLGPHPHYTTSDARDDWTKHRRIPIPDAREREPLLCSPQDQRWQALDARAVLHDNLGKFDAYAAERTRAFIIHAQRAIL
jgi:hypothetical protein